MSEPETIQSKTVNTSTPNQSHSRIGVIWISLAAFTLLLLMLVIFILQNNNNVDIEYLGFDGSLPFGIAMLLAAITGAILTLLVGTIRIVQLKISKRNN